MGSIPTPFVCKDEPIENQRPMKVRVIGAGFSGLYLGIRIPQRLRNIDFQIYEKNEGVGGTWWENRYPGCACDIPAHSYQYTFEPNPNWSGFYAPAQEIYRYLQKVADKYGVPRFVKLSHKVTRCEWNDVLKKWKLTVENLTTGESFEEDADVVVSCRGNLNEFKYPDIPGLKTFKGEVMHSAKWNQSYDFKNRKIGIIGGGSSSVQIVPQLQKVEGAQLSCFVRSKMWISNPFGDYVMQKLGLDITELDFTNEQRLEFSTNDEKYLEFRKIIEADGNHVHLLGIRGSDFQNMLVQTFKDLMKVKLATRPELIDHFTPSFGVGCRRLTPGPGYLEALLEENVDFITEKIATITPTGVKLNSGREIELDVLACATGFNATSIPPYPIIGNKGITLEQRFKPYPETYLSLAVDDFPNFFMMLGPNSGIGAGSLTILLEHQGDYITKCIRKLQKEDYASMMPKASRVSDFADYVTDYFKKTIYTDDCDSWYKSQGGKGIRINALWPGSILHAMECLRSPRWEDFEYESRNENRLAWLGNGWSTTLTGEGDPAWYLEPIFVDKPTPVTPENDSVLAMRSFSN